MVKFKTIGGLRRAIRICTISSVAEGTRTSDTGQEQQCWGIVMITGNVHVVTEKTAKKVIQAMEQWERRINGTDGEEWKRR